MTSPSGDLDDFDDFDDDAPSKPKVGLSRIRMALMRWWLILLFGVLGYFVALYVLSIVESTHQATAVMEVITRQQQLVGEELEMEKLGVDQTMITIANKITGPGLLEKVAARPGILALEKAVPPPFSLKPRYWRGGSELAFKPAAAAERGELIRMISSGLKVTPRKGTTLIDVTFTHQDADTALIVANEVIEAYLETEVERKTGGATDAFKVLRAEANDAAKELETAQRSIKSYKTVLETNELLKTQRDELVLFKQRYKARHPKMLHAVSLQTELKQRFQREIESVMRQSQDEIDFWASHRTAMAEYEQVIQSLGPEATELSPEDEERLNLAEERWLALVQGALSAREGLLQGRIANKQSLYDTVTKRISEIDVSEENAAGKIKVAEPAYRSGSTATANSLRLVQGVFGGLLAGFAVAYLLGIIDYKIYDVRTVEEATGLPCLSAIPENAMFASGREWRNVLETEPNGMNAEAIRNLRASVTLLGKAERHKSILVTSAVPGEGKTTVASELAAAFALSDQKTILVDLDLRKPRVHTLFPKQEKSLGMADVLAGQAGLENVVQKTAVKGLDVIVAGSRAANPSELLQEDDLDAIISRLKEFYDRVIIDSPPVLPVSDTRLLVGHAQSVILVVRANKAPVGAVMRAKELLSQAGAPIAGVVINGMTRRNKGAGYYGYKGYGEYGGYGGYYGGTEKKA